MHDSLIRHHYTVREADLNQYGLMHGGRLLTLADETGFLAAHRHANADCLTLAVYRARFYRSLPLGRRLIFEARVAFTGRTSLWVPVRVEDGQGRKPAMESVIIFVAVDKDKRPREVPQVVAQTSSEQELQSRIRRLHARIREET